MSRLAQGEKRRGALPAMAAALVAAAGAAGAWAEEPGRPAQAAGAAGQEQTPPRKGPARIAPPLPAPEPSREVAADEKREELIADLLRLIPRMEEGPRKAELLFQLAEYHWEKSRALSLREVKEYDAAYGRWTAARAAQGPTAAGPEPRVSTAGSDAARADALAVYRSLLAAYPKYARRDEVLFVVAHNLYESGDKPAALKAYERLIAETPESRFVPDAWVQLGEHFFAANDLARARAAFEHAAVGAKAKVYAFALYKLAWCDYNAGDYRGAIDKFERVVAYSQAQAQEGGAARDRIQLASEALKDLVLPFAQLDEIDGAIAYFKEKDPAHAFESADRLGAAFFEAGKFEQAIQLYRRLEDEAPGHARAPAWQQRILLSYDKLNRRDDVARETRRLVQDYGPSSQWAKAHQAEKSALADGSELAESALRDLVQDYHQEAVRTKNAATYRLARDIYRQYLDSFPEAPGAGRLRFYYAEILYALGDWEAAADQYDAVAARDPKGELAQRAAYDQILALEKSLAAQRGALRSAELADQEPVDETKAKGQVQEAHAPRAGAVAKDAAEEPIPPLEEKLLRACERYLAVVPGAKDEIVIRYKAALIHYDHRRYLEAARRFAEIILRWPGDAWSQKAADLSMNILEAKEQWLALSDLAGRFHEDPVLAPPGGELWRRTAAVAENARFYFVMDLYQRKKDPAAAAVEFLRFADAYPKSKNAPVALHNAIVIAEAAGELDRVIAAGERFVREHPRADGAIARPALLSLSSAYAQTGRFEEAARVDVAFASRFPRDPRAPEALASAAVWKEAVGDDAGAIVLCRRFLDADGARAEAAKVAFNLGLLHERRKEWRLALRSWTALRRDHGRGAAPGELIIARYKEAIALRALHADKAQVAAALSDALARFRALPEAEKQPAVVDAAAHARFLLAEKRFEEFMRLQFTSNRQSRLVAILQAKNARLKELAEDYADVIRIGSAVWSEAALTRLGAAYRDFNKALLDAPSPRGFDREQQELYRSTLESQALPLEDKAIEAFQKALETGARFGAYTEWTLRAQELLRDYQPDAFGEIRSPSWWFGEPVFAAAPAGLAVSAERAPRAQPGSTAGGGAP